MLTQTPQEIANNSALGETVPYSLALLHLFSHAPDEMKSPHQVILQILTTFNFLLLLIFIFCLVEWSQLDDRRFIQMVR